MKAYWRRLVAIRTRKKGLADQVKRHASHLQKGTWMLSESTIARHASVGTMPGSLHSTKSVRRNRHPLWRAKLRELLYAAVPPWRVRLDHGASTPPGRLIPEECGILVAAKAGGAVLIDLKRSQVLRVGPRQLARPRYAEMRDALREFLVLPDSEILSDGISIRESFIEGDSFLSVAPELRQTAILRLMGQYENLTASTAEPAPGDFWSHVFEHAINLPLSSRARSCVNSICRDEIIQNLPFTPAHGDLSGSNILVTQPGPVLIDLEDCALLPAGFDLFFLAHQEHLAGRRDLWDYYIMGPAWNRVYDIVTASRVRGLGPTRSTCLTALFLAECVLWTDKTGSYLLDEKTLGRWWEPIQQVTEQRQIERESSGEVQCGASSTGSESDRGQQDANWAQE